MSKFREVLRRFNENEEASLLPHISRYAMGSLGPAFISLISIAVFTRRVDTAEFGIFTIAINTVNLFTVLLSEWLKQSINRYLPVQKNFIEINLTRTAIGLGLLGIWMTAFILGTLLGLIKLKINLVAFLLPVTILVAETSTQVILCVILQTELKSWLFGIYQFGFATAKFLIALLFVSILDKTADSLLYGYIFGIGLLLIPLWFHTKLSIAQTLKQIKDPKIWISLKQLFFYGFPMIGWYLSSQLLNYGDRYIIQAYYGSNAVGVYTANYNIIYGAVGLISAPVLLGVTPLLMKMWSAGQREQIQRLIAKIFFFYPVLAAPVIVIIMIHGKTISGLLLGAEYQTGYRVMLPVGLGVMVWHLSMYGHKTFEFSEKTALMMGLSMGCALVNLVLNRLLTPRYGIEAAAWITLVSYLLYFIMVFLSSRKYLPWKIPWKPLLYVPVAICSGWLGMISIQAGINGLSVLWSVITGWVMFLIIYSCILLKFKPWQKI